MQKIYSVFLFCCLCFFSCATMPNKDEEEVVVETSVPQQVVETKKEEPKKEEPKTVVTETKNEVDHESEVIAEFGDVKITKKHYNDTMNEIKIIVDGLNKTTASKDYNKWLTYLSKLYKDTYSNHSILKKTSETLPIKGLKLNTLKDYFNYVFVPSRQNIKVEDIIFLSPIKVNVIMLNKGRNLLVYKLEKIDGRWLLMPRL